MFSSILSIGNIPMASLVAAIGFPLAAVVRSRASKGRIPAQEILMDKLPDGVMILDASDRILKINPAMRKIIGSARRDFTRREAREVIPDWTEWLKLLREHKGTAVVPSPFHAEPMLEIRRWPMRNSAGKPGGSMILVRDITDRLQSAADNQRSTNLLQEQSTQIQTLRTSLQEQAVRDPATNLFNRCYLVETLSRELARAARTQSPVGLMIISLDQFQEINKTYGSKAGIEVVKIMGSLLNRNIRKGDIPSRYAADEFVVVMPGAPLAVTGSRAEQLRAAFQDSILNFLGSVIRNTFSCGVAASPDHGATSEELLQSAGKALDQSKAAGGNRVTVFE
jgi:diguanylate cyclase (GGDEF)-like protein/PAS domain S-box-containing protein